MENRGEVTGDDREKIDVYDRDGRRTGRVIRRGDPFGPGEYPKIVQVVVFNDRDQMLIQQRAEAKQDLWSGLWDVTVCGGVLAGENSREAARRELREEMGIDQDFSEMMPHVTVFYGAGFSDVYLVRREADPEKLELQREEVAAARWAGMDEILQMIEDGTFIAYRPGWIRYLFDMRDGYGNFIQP